MSLTLCETVDCAIAVGLSTPNGVFLRLTNQLFPNQLGVHATGVLDKLLVGPNLYHFPLVDHNDPVCSLDGTESVGYNNNRPSIQVSI